MNITSLSGQKQLLVEDHVLLLMDTCNSFATVYQSLIKPLIADADFHNFFEIHT